MKRNILKKIKNNIFRGSKYFIPEIWYLKAVASYILSIIGYKLLQLLTFISARDQAYNDQTFRKIFL